MLARIFKMPGMPRMMTPAERRVLFSCHKDRRIIAVEAIPWSCALLLKNLKDCGTRIMLQPVSSVLTVYYTRPGTIQPTMALCAKAEEAKPIRST